MSLNERHDVVPTGANNHEAPGKGSWNTFTKIVDTMINFMIPLVIIALFNRDRSGHP